VHSLNRKRSEWLDVLRGIAIISVVSVHSLALTDSFNLKNESDFFVKIIDLGKYGVELFFFLSGWLLASIYGINTKEVLGRSYWIRRFARIYPLWLLFLGITLFRWQMNGSGPLKSIFLNADDPSSFFLNPGVIVLLSLTFTLFVSGALWNSVIPGGWSIQAEIAHYLLFPILRKKSTNYVLCAVASANLITAILYIMRQEFESTSNLAIQILDSWFRLGLFSTVSFFLIGMLSFSFFNAFQSSSKTANAFLMQKVSPIACLYFLTSTLVVPAPFGTQIEATGYLLVCLLFGVGTLNCRRISEFLRLLGRYSYFIYFMHFLVLDAVRSASKNLDFSFALLAFQQVNYFLVFIFTLSVSLLFAIPSFKLFEQPLIRFAQRFGVSK
jgi:peptidoglycan/LPS O-acetylase OafA/YrhL